MGNLDFGNFIEGERIFLREVRVTDVNENYYQWMNDYDITKYTESRFSPYSLENLMEYVKIMETSKDNVFLAIIDNETKKHIGNIKLGNINWLHKSADIGIIIGDKEFWGKGYATEAIKYLCRFAFNILNLNRVFAGCYILNKGSIGAFKKVGFKEEGVFKEQFFFEGNYIDGIVLGLTASAFNRGGNDL